MLKNSKRKYTVGIDLGGTKIAAGLCENGKILEKIVVPTNASKGVDAVMATISQAARLAMKGVEPACVSGVGVGAAGQVHPKNGSVVYAPNLGWNNVPLAEKLAADICLPIKVINDVRAATIAEWKYGAGVGLHDFANIFLGTGIGSGFVLNGILLEGTTNSAGEIGHVCLDPDGPVCGCGKKGCFEAFSSGRGLENHVRSLLSDGAKSIITGLVEGDLSKITGHIIGSAAAARDKVALEALKHLGKYLGLAIANIHTMLNPQVVILGGGIMALKEYFMSDMNESVSKHILPVAAREGLVTMAAFETDAVLIGSSAVWM